VAIREIVVDYLRDEAISSFLCRCLAAKPRASAHDAI